jgi:hypothetical protein
MSKLEIIIGTRFSADFTLSDRDGFTGVVLDPTDTAVFTLTTAGETNTVVLDKIPMTIVDADNGVFNLTLDETQTAILEQDIGFKEDRYNTISNYNGRIDFNVSKVSPDPQAVLPVFVKGA